MLKDSKEIIENFKQTVKNLALSAANLNELTDKLTKNLIEFEEGINSFNIGLVCWTTLYDTPKTKVEIGYYHKDGKWGIYCHDLMTDVYWPLRSAPRAFRIKAVECLPELTNQLDKVVKESITLIQEKQEKINELKGKQ